MRLSVLVRDALGKLGYPWLALVRCNFPAVTRLTIAHGYTTVSFTPILPSSSKLLLFWTNSFRANRQSIQLEGRKLVLFLVYKRNEAQ